MAFNFNNNPIENIYYNSNEVLVVKWNNVVVWEKDTEDHFHQYLTTKIIDGGDFYWNGDSSVEFSLDSGSTWERPSSFGLPTRGGDVIMWKGSCKSGTIGSFSGNNVTYDVEGNIMTLIYGNDILDLEDLDNYTELPIGTTSEFSGLCKNTSVVNARNLVIPCDEMHLRTCQYMFSGCTSLETAPELPATTLSEACYGNMFQDCTSLTTAPSLSATTLAQSCCEGMFANCRSIVTAPSVLPATTLANSCYQGMFWGCTSLTTAPELPATTLTDSCYSYMFGDCTSLNYIKMLATDISATLCLAGWVTNVAAIGTFVKSESMTELPIGDDGIPTEWTVEDATE